MRAPIVVATAALLLLPTLVEAQRTRAAGGAGSGGASAGSGSARSGSAAAPRARASGDGRSRSPAASTSGRGDPATAGAPGSWGSGPSITRPADGRPPHRSSPYGSTPYRSSPHRPVTPYYYVPIAPYGYYPYGAYPYGAHPYHYFGYDYGRVTVGGSTLVVVTPQVTTPVEAAPADGYASAPAVPAAAQGKLLVVGGEGEAPLLDVQPVSDSLLRLRWSGRAADVREVALLLLDADRALLAAQTVREAPYTAVFDRSPRAAFAGVAVTYGSGATMTTVVPLAAADSVPAAAPAPPRE